MYLLQFFLIIQAYITLPSCQAETLKPLGCNLYSA